MTSPLLLLPAPRRLAYTGGHYALPQDRLILLDVPDPQALRFTAERVQSALEFERTQLAAGCQPRRPSR